MYTGDSHIAIPSFTSYSIAKKLSSLPAATYSSSELYIILEGYDAACKSVELDTFLVVAQNLHETNYMRSWWSQAPRNNPAGIGVTGATHKNKIDPVAWQYDSRSGIYRQGYAFENWKVAIDAHVGHLLSYVYVDGDMNGLQLKLSDYSPRKRFIPAENRGSVKVLRDLNNKWAVPGTNYGQAIAKVANTLLEWSM